VAQSVQRVNYGLDSMGSIVGRDMASVAFRLTLRLIQTSTQGISGAVFIAGGKEAGTSS
jgi:hypothetical protein